MKTIRAFERALGRKVFWSPRWSEAKGTYEEVSKLRIYPHALREPNAYYSRDKKALLFGYFRSSAREAGANWVFTALSHDIIIHETTHAILDGLHRRYAEPTSYDSLAFHEAFADIVALLSHFTLTEAVRSEIALEGGRLDGRSLMSGLARQFSVATGKAGALRDAIDPKVDGAPDGRALDALTEPHERGAILVAAVFDAFLTIYQRCVADLLRLANVGVGEARALHPDLVERLTREAAKAKEYAAFVQELRQKLTCLTTQRSDWYRGQHHASRWVTSARTLMVWLGTGGVLATAIAAGLRACLAAHNSNSLYDIAVVGVALVLYAGMAAVSFFERAAKGSGHYFRSVLGILAIGSFGSC